MVSKRQQNKTHHTHTQTQRNITHYDFTFCLYILYALTFLSNNWYEIHFCFGFLLESRHKLGSTNKFNTNSVGLRVRYIFHCSLPCSMFITGRQCVTHKLNAMAHVYTIAYNKFNCIESSTDAYTHITFRQHIYTYKNTYFLHFYFALADSLTHSSFVCYLQLLHKINTALFTRLRNI